MKVEDLFPPCLNARCGEPGSHRHILPAQREMLNAQETFIASIGGFGSGKSVSAAVLVHLLLSAIPGNRALIARTTYPKLQDTAQRTFMDVLHRSGIEYDGRENRDGWPRWIIYPNGSEVVFRETKDPGRFLGPEYGVWWLDEAGEMPERLLVDLTGRLRLPVAMGHLRGLITSNPMPHTHWLTRMFGVEPGVTEVKDPDSGHVSRYRRIGSRSMDNPALPPEYVANLRAILPAAEASRVLEGKTGFQHDGKPVYTPPFSYQKHVGTPEPLKDADGLLRPMTRGWDFGYHVPAVLWSQITLCWERRLHWRTFDEYIGQNLEAEDLAKVVISRSREQYPHARVWVDIGDAAGASLSDKGPGSIIRLSRPPFSLQFRYRKFPSVDPGIALIRELLKQGNCKCGEPTIVIHRRCKTLIDALSGGYHYPAIRYGHEEKSKPKKDGYYDNPADAYRYMAELAYRPASMDTPALDRLTEWTPPHRLWKIPGRPDPLVQIVDKAPLALGDSRS